MKPPRLKTRWNMPGSPILLGERTWRQLTFRPRRAAVLFDFATHADYRAAVRREFDGIHALFGEYQAALRKAYPVPKVPDPR